MATWKKILTEDSSGDISVSGNKLTFGNGVEIDNTGSGIMQISPDAGDMSLTIKGQTITDNSVVGITGERATLQITSLSSSSSSYINLYNSDNGKKWSMGYTGGSSSFVIANEQALLSDVFFEIESSTGDVNIEGEVYIKGNKLKPITGGTSPLQWDDSGNVTVGGTLKISQNGIKASTGDTVITLSNNDIKLSDNLYLNSDNANIYFGSSSVETLSISGQDEYIRILNSEDSTSSPDYPLVIESMTSGTPITGYGVGVKFKSESLGGPSHDMGSLEYLYTDIDNGEEDVKIVFKGSVDGTPSTLFTILDSGNLDIEGMLLLPNGVQISNSTSGSLSIFNVDVLALSSAGASGEDCQISLLPNSGYDAQINFFESVGVKWTIGNDGSDDTDHKFHFGFQDTDVGDSSIFAIGSSGFVTFKNGAAIANTTSGTLNISAIGNHTGHLVARHMTSTFGTTGNMVLSDNSIEVTGLLKLDTTGDITLETDTGNIHFDSDLTHTGGTLGKIADETTRTAFYLYEKAGLSTDDFFKITVAEKGATTITTTDASVAFGEGADADLKIDPDGELHLVGTNTALGADSTIKFFQGSDQLGSFSSHHAMNDFRINGYDDTSKFLTINVDGDANANFTTYDGDALTHDADITLNPDGQLKLKSWGDIDIYNGAVITTPAFKLGMSAGSASEFYMYESSGLSNDDYFKIKVGTHGETIIDTVDGAVSGTSANLTFNIDGDCDINSVRDIYLDATRSVVLETDTAQIRLNPSTYIESMKPIMIKEAASPETHVASYGQIYVKNESPAQLWYQDDAGTASRLDNQGGGSSFKKQYLSQLHRWGTDTSPSTSEFYGGYSTNYFRNAIFYGLNATDDTDISAYAWAIISYGDFLAHAPCTVTGMSAVARQDN